MLVLSAFALTFAPVSLHALTDAEATTGRDLVKRFADTVVSVEMVVTIKVTVGDRAMPPRESKVEMNGTVISPTGLTVTALSAIDPRSQLEAVRDRTGQKIELGETEYKEVKLRLANGTEVPAVVVLKDADLDLAFIAPLAEGAATPQVFACIDLGDAATAEVLGNYFSVSRAPKNFQRTPLVRTTTVTGIVEKPRRLFLLSVQDIGAPVLDRAGHVLGLPTQFLVNGRPSGLVVLPAADVAEIAKQAAAIKPEAVAQPAPVEPAAPAAPAKTAPEAAAKP